jgi:hypothetical protein
MFGTTDASGFVQLCHHRTVDRLALLVDLVDKWSDLSISLVKSTNRPTSRKNIVSKTKE